MCTADAGGNLQESFKGGLHSYLHAHVNGNALTSYLWRSLGQAISEGLEAMMQAWTLVLMRDAMLMVGMLLQ